LFGSDILQAVQEGKTQISCLQRNAYKYYNEKNLEWRKFDTEVTCFGTIKLSIKCDRTLNQDTLYKGFYNLENSQLTGH